MSDVIVIATGIVEKFQRMTGVSKKGTEWTRVGFKLVAGKNKIYISSFDENVTGIDIGDGDMVEVNAKLKQYHDKDGKPKDGYDAVSVSIISKGDIGF